jgi:hypothetical protein
MGASNSCSEQGCEAGSGSIWKLFALLDLDQKLMLDPAPDLAPDLALDLNKL